MGFSWGWCASGHSEAFYDVLSASGRAGEVLMGLAWRASGHSEAFYDVLSTSGRAGEVLMGLACVRSF